MNNKLLPAPALLIFALFFSLLLCALQAAQPELLFQRKAIQDGEFWRFWSSHLVHTNYNHLLLNLAGFWIFIMLCGPVLNLKLLISSIFITATTISLLLFLYHSEIYWYGGFSGVLYGLFTTGAVYLAIRHEWLLAAGLLLLLGLKLSGIGQSGSDELTSQLIAANIIEEAHLYGTAAGLLTPFLHFFLGSLKNHHA